MRTVSHPPPDQLSLPSVLHALSDPVRLEIVRALHDGSELSCGGLNVSVAKSTLSHHLRVLRDAGVIQTRSQGTRRLVSGFFGIDSEPRRVRPALRHADQHGHHPFA